MLPPAISPTLLGQHGPVEPTLCRLSPDLARLAFWVPEANPPGLFVGDVAHADQIGLFAKRVWSTDDASLSDLAWSGDGQYLAFVVTSGPPPGQPRIGVLRLSDQSFTELPGFAFAFAGSGATLLIADPAASRLYLRDLDLGVEHRVAEIADDGDPHFAPVLSVSPDHRRVALVTRRVREDATAVLLAEHDGRAWHARPLSEIPGTSLRILPFFSADSHALALYVLDIAQHHTAIIAVPERDGPGDVLYTSDSIDGFVTPAPHPDGRLIAFVRAHPKPDAPTLVEPRLCLVDPVEHSVAPITPDGTIVGQPRWLDPQTLLVEGGPSVWTVTLRAAEAPADAAAAPDPDAAASESTPVPDATVRTVVRDIDPSLTFACELPPDWKRIPLPDEPIDFADPRVLRPIAVFGPPYATILFSVSTRPMFPGLTPAAALEFLAAAQGLDPAPVTPTVLPGGPAAQMLTTQRSGEAVMKLRLLLLEDGGHLFSITALAPAPLWDAVRPSLDRAVESFTLLDPRGPTASSSD